MKLELNIPDKFKERKLWLAVISAIVAFGNVRYGWNLTVEQVFLIIAPLLWWIGVEGYRDIVATKNGCNNELAYNVAKLHMKVDQLLGEKGK